MRVLNSWPQHMNRPNIIFFYQSNSQNIINPPNIRFATTCSPWARVISAPGFRFKWKGFHEWNQRERQMYIDRRFI